MGYYRDPERPFKMISMDLCGPYTRTRAGNRFILVVVDSFSKFILCKALRTATANATIDFLEHEVFLKYCVPSVLISDNGPQLRAAMFAEFPARHGVKHWKTPMYHAQANATEAANKTVITQKYWDTHLPEIGCALNSSRHSTTQYPPYTILFGFDMCVNGDEHVAVETTTNAGITRKIIWQRVSENLRSAYERSKIRYDRDRTVRHIEYQPGQIVWRANTKLSNLVEGYCSKM